MATTKIWPIHGNLSSIRKQEPDRLIYRNMADDQIERIRAEKTKPPVIKRIK